MLDDQKDSDIVQLYMVVCTNLHACIGPFADMASAVQMAREWTNRKKDSCIYLPVPMIVPEGVELVKPATTQGDGPVLRGGGGYL